MSGTGIPDEGCSPRTASHRLPARTPPVFCETTSPQPSPSQGGSPKHSRFPAADPQTVARDVSSGTVPRHKYSGPAYHPAPTKPRQPMMIEEIPISSAHIGTGRDAVRTCDRPMPPSPPTESRNSHRSRCSARRCRIRRQIAERAGIADRVATRTRRARSHLYSHRGRMKNRHRQSKHEQGRAIHASQQAAEACHSPTFRHVRAQLRF